MEGDCHYLEGNLNARRRVEYVQKLLQQIGLEPERIRMVNLSSAMGGKFAESTTEMFNDIQAIGLNPLKHVAAEQQLVEDAQAGDKPGSTE